MRTRFEPGAVHPGLRPGFTLIELLVVVVIIGIIITFLLVAAGDARRRAEEDATLALITKLEGGINDRLDALLQTRPDPNPAHYYMAGIFTGLMDGNGNQEPVGWPQSAYGGAATRAQVFAWYDYIKGEMPDVFFVQNFNPGSYAYPLNFAFPATNGGKTGGYPGGTIDQQGLGNFILPIGNSITGPLIPPPPPPTILPGYGAGNFSNTLGTGIYGASYSAAAGIYKNLGYLPAGYDGIDNNGNGLIDEWAEGVYSPPTSTTSPPSPTYPKLTVQAQVLGNLNAHTHNTARSETLYAILVEGVGPLGAFFNRDDFSDREVQDTDHDGLPEFVDAWGQPLQFYRWPLLYHSETQKGQVIDYFDNTQTPPYSEPLEWFNPPYRSVFEAREQDALDPNQQLMAPAWWSKAANTNSPFTTMLSGTAGTVGASGGVIAFEYFFHRLTEPLNTGNPLFSWDRASPVYPQGTLGFRRAFLSKPLIISSGPDQQLGIYQLPNTPTPTAAQLLLYENNALQFDASLFNNGETVSGGTTVSPAAPPQPNPTYSTYLLRDNGRDDISNQNRQATGGPGGS